MPAAPKLLLFTPLYQERVWGGRALQTALGRNLDEGKTIGESWEVVDRPKAQSRVAAGPWAGRTLRQIIAADPVSIMGPQWSAARPFPILVKWLDARDRMSLQVHPPAALAAELGGEAKSENWYIAEAVPGATIIAGLKRGVTVGQFLAALHAGKLDPVLHRVLVRTGDSIFMPSGRLHAIEAGSLILEIQQNSDTTYRVYDWGRVGLDGRPRDLHLQESLQCIDFGDDEPRPIPPGPNNATLADGEHFRLRRVPLDTDETLGFSARGQPRIVSLVAGELATDEPAHPILQRGANALVPFASSVDFRAIKPSIVLITENFA